MTVSQATVDSSLGRNEKGDSKMPKLVSERKEQAARRIEKSVMQLTDRQAEELAEKLEFALPLIKAGTEKKAG